MHYQHLHRNTTMLLLRQALALCCQLRQCSAYAETCVARFYYIVDISELCCLVRVSEEIAILFLLFQKECLHIATLLLYSLSLLGREYSYRTAGTHYGNLS